jgi:Mg-chelatase subunit ChlD
MMHNFRLPAALLLSLPLCAGCGGTTSPPAGKKPPSVITADRTPYGITPIDLPQGEQKPGPGVVILVDTSGSMAQDVKEKGGQRAKHLIAQDALNRIVEHTAAWKKKNPERQLQMGIYHFSSNVAPVLAMEEFNEANARAAITRIPRPTGGTAIGAALEEGIKALYKSGSMRKYVVCITDGENTAGLPPDRVARQMHAQTKGEVEIHFVAFDTSARHFNFLKDVNGHVVQAADGPQLQAELTRIYDKRILAEAEDPAVK